MLLCDVVGNFQKMAEKANGRIAIATCFLIGRFFWKFWEKKSRKFLQVCSVNTISSIFYGKGIQKSQV
jgi:hypothetical protein